MYRRKRRSRGTWLPTFGTLVSENNESYLSGFGFTLSVDDDGDIASLVYPITADAPAYQGDNVGNNTTMAEVIGNEYFLDRIVGKLFLHYTPSEEVDLDVTSGPVLVSAGFFVARADDSNFMNPVGGSTTDEVRDNYSPLELDTIREPWIWRRTWILGVAGWQSAAPNSGTSGAGTARYYTSKWPCANWLYGSVLDGPHIDAKTKRRVGQEDRLWLALSASYVPGWPKKGSGDQSAAIYGYFDYRLHGALRRARQTGKF